MTEHQGIRQFSGFGSPQPDLQRPPYLAIVSMPSMYCDAPPVFACCHAYTQSLERELGTQPQLPLLYICGAFAGHRQQVCTAVQEGRCERDGAEPGERGAGAGALPGRAHVGGLLGAARPGQPAHPLLHYQPDCRWHHYHLLLPAGHLMRPKLAKAKSGKNVDFPASGSA